MEHLDGQLRNWVAAGLISIDQQAAISAFEAGQQPGVPEPEVSSLRWRSALPGAGSLAAGMGMVLALIGFEIIIYSPGLSLRQATRGGIWLGLATIAVIAIWQLGTVTEARRQWSVFALLVTTVALGMGAYELSTAGAWFTRVVEHVSDGYDRSVYRETSTSGDTAFALLLVLLPLFYGILRRRSGICGAFLAAASYLAVAAVVDALQAGNNDAHLFLSLGFVAVGAVQIALADLAQRERTNAAELLRLSGVFVPCVALLSSGDRAHLWMGALSAAIAGSACWFGVRRGRRQGLLIGGVASVAALIVDIGVRNFGNDQTTLALYFMATGLVICVLVVARHHHGRRARADTL